MDYEKLYKEALERASKYYNANTNKGYREIFEDIFHEFKESEDERIRKEIISFITDRKNWFPKDETKASWISWLEKQDTKLQEYINEERNKKDFYCEGKEMSWNEMPLDIRKHDYPYYFKGNLDCYPFNVEKQGEQKPIEQDTEIRDLWVYIREWNDKFGRLPKDEDELASCIDYVIKRQKPAGSEEDEKKRELLISILEVNHPNGYFKVNPINTTNMEAMSTKELVNWLKSIKPNHWKPSEEQMEALNAINTIGEISYVGQDDLLIKLYNDLKNL